MIIPRRPSTKMIQGSQVIAPDGREVMLWTGQGHEGRAGSQARAREELMLGEHKVRPVWVEVGLHDRERLES